MSPAGSQSGDINFPFPHWRVEGENGVETEGEDDVLPMAQIYSSDQRSLLGTVGTRDNIEPVTSDNMIQTIEPWLSQSPQLRPLGDRYIASARINRVINVPECSQGLGDQQFNSRQQLSNHTQMAMFIGENSTASTPEYLQGRGFNFPNALGYTSMQCDMPTSYINSLSASGSPISNATSLGFDGPYRPGDSVASPWSFQEHAAHKRRRTHPTLQDSVIASSSTWGTGQSSCDSLSMSSPTPDRIALCACSIWLSRYPENPHSQPNDHEIYALSKAFDTSPEALQFWFQKRQKRQKLPTSHSRDITAIANDGCRLWTWLHPGERPDFDTTCALSAAFDKPFDYIHQWFNKTLQADAFGQYAAELTIPSVVGHDVAAKYQHNQKACKNGQNTSRCEGWNTELPYSCTFRCGMRFKTRGTWQRHEETNLPQSIWQCILQECRNKPFVTTRKDVARKHLTEHHPEIDKHYLEFCRIPVESRFNTFCIFEGCEENFIDGQPQYRWKKRMEHIAKHMEDRPWDISNLKELEPAT